MGIINWARSRLSAKRESRGFDAGVPEEQWRPEEDQEAGVLLSIGTFGEKKDAKATTHELPEFTIEEAEKLQDALEKLLRRARSKSSARRGDDSLSLPPLDRFLNCPSSLEVDRRLPPQKHDDEGGHTKIVLTMAKDLLASCSGTTSNTNNKGAGVKNKSFKFLLRKMLVCDGGGFAPAPSLKDPVESRIDKFFRTVLGRKIDVRPTNATAGKKYCLEDKRFNGKSRGGHRRAEDGDGEKEEDCCRWDRTDSEFIVLEI